MPGLFRSLETPDSDPPIGAGIKSLDGVVMPKRREKYPWCHFTTDTEIAPNWMKSLSDEAGLPKEKLVFSYLLAVKPEEGLQARKFPSDSTLLRIVSEEFPLPDYTVGRYACSAEGYSLVRYSPLHIAFASGDLVRRPKAPTTTLQARSETPDQHKKALSEKTGSHFANILDRRPPSSSRILDKNHDIDEKSGAIIVSY
jgi:hypothetical protein